METLHRKLQLDQDINDVLVPQKVRAIFESEHDGVGRELLDAELEKDESGIWVTFWMPSELGVEDHNQVEVTAGVVAVGNSDIHGDSWVIREVRIHKLW